MARVIAKWSGGLVVTLALFIAWQAWSVIPAMTATRNSTPSAAAQRVSVPALASGGNGSLLAANEERIRSQRREMFHRLIHEHGRPF
jgi:hypothetical protein